MDIRMQKTIQLKDYGIEGEITLEPLNFRRRKILQNNIGKCIDINSVDGEVMKSQNMGDVLVYKVMAYIVSAPFKYDSLDGFYNFMDRLDRNELGSADRLFDELNNAVSELGQEESSPLDKSPTASPQSDTERTY